MTGTTEFPEQAKTILRAFEMGFALYRNNSGVSREEHRHVRFGLGNDSAKINKVWKSTDLVGIGPNGRALWVEMKQPAWVWKGTEHEVAQANAINDINSRGGIAFFCTSADEFEKIIKGLMTVV
jgi:hypothetical protein